MNLRALSTVLAAAMLACGAASRALEPPEQLRFADGLFTRGMWDVALKEYQSYLDQNTNRPGAEAVYYRMGECQRALGQAADADRLYRQAADAVPGGEYRFRAGLRRAELLEQAGRRDDQIQLLTALLTEKPADELAAACRYALGDALEKAGRRESAAAAYEEIVANDTGTPYVAYAALALAGLCRQQSNGLERAAALFQTAVSNAASPRAAAEGWFQLGDVYFRLKAFEQSARAYEKVTSLYGGDERAAAARLPMAWSFYYAGLYAETLKVCANAAGGGTGKPEEWLYLKANSERQLLRNEDAVATYAQLLEKFPQADLSDSAAYERALTLYKMGKFAEANQQARLVALTPRVKKDVYWLLAESCAALNDDAGAVQYYRLLVEQFPDSGLAGDALYRLGNLAQKKGEMLEASGLFEQLAANYATHALAPQALFAAAACLGKAQKHEQAVAAWARLIERYPESKFVEESLYQKAMVEAYLRRDGQARTTLGALLDQFPKSRFLADARFWNGVLLDEAGKAEEADLEFRRALKAEPGEDLRARIEFRLALVLQRRGANDEAATLLQGLTAAPARVPFTPELLEWLADYQLGRQAFAVAAADAELLIGRAATNSWKQIGWCLKGKALQGQGQPDAARQAFEQVVALDARSPAAAESFLRLGDILLAAGNAAAAKERYDRAAAAAESEALLPVRANAYAGLARALKAEGDMAGAARHFLSVAVLFDDPALTPECLYEASEALRRGGKADDAAKALKELQERYPDSAWAKKR
jgi:TolA-binding protein